jgi:hypothetical protein
MGDVKRLWMEKSAGSREKISCFHQMMLQRIKDIFDTSVSFPCGNGRQKNIDNKIKFFYY